MYRIIIMLIVFLSAFSAFSQTFLQDGDDCFEKGDYKCAITNYDQAFKLASGRDKQIADIKLNRAKLCQDYIESANQAFKNRQYAEAKAKYLDVLESNPKDSYAQSQLQKCDVALNPAPTLSVSKENLSFPANGGTENIIVTTNKSSFSVKLLPSWCTVQIYSDYFVISCSTNPSTTARDDYFNVTVGDKTVRINVTQSGKQEAPKTETTLSVSEGNLSFPSSGGTKNITVTTNNGPYSVNLLPSWCTVRKYSGYFVISCFANPSTTARDDYFKVAVGDKTVRIDVTQAGKQEEPKIETTLSVSQGNLSFPASGGTKNITVTTNNGPYSVNLLPSWCTVQKYSGYFVISCSTNPSTIIRNDYFTVTAGDKTVRINVAQSGKQEEPKIETSLSVSQGNLSFPVNGGTKNITVTTNNGPYSVNLLPSWCTVQKYSGYFVITCSANPSTIIRNDFFTITAGDKTVRINVAQSGKQEEPKTETTSNPSKWNLSFPARGGSENVTVTTNKGSYSVNSLPSWCTVQKYFGYFVLSCSANSSTTTRNGYFTVTAGGKTVRINVAQSGKRGGIASDNFANPPTKIKEPFNNPKTKDTWGLTMGYANYDFGEGIQFGLKAEPLFKYGFGMNTGINIEAYSGDVLNALSKWEFEEYGVNIPLHLEYRLNFSKWFNLFFYGGAGFYAVTDADFSDYVLPVTFDYGGGLRINHVQFNVGRNSYLGDFRAIDSFGKNIRPLQNYFLSISYMF